MAGSLIQRSFDDGVKEWRACVFVPTRQTTDLFTGLILALAEVLPALRGGGVSMEDLVSSLFKDPGGTVKLAIAPAFLRAAEAVGGTIRVLLVLDQMEELWTDPLRITPETRERFLEAIEALAASGHLACLATLRSDFYPQAQLSPAFLRLKGERGHVDLTPPGPAALQRLITEPARLAGLQFEKDATTGRTLDQLILEDAARDPSALPLLQYALAELYRTRDGQSCLTFAAYHTMGGVEGGLSCRIAAVFADLPPSAQGALEEILPLLVTVDTQGEQSAVRRRAAMADLTATEPRTTLTTALTAARFLTTDQDKDGTPTASLAHESLLRNWPRLTAWLATNHEFLRTSARIAARMKEGSPLLDGDPLLTAAQAHLQFQSAAFTPAQRDFILQSTAAAEAKSRRATRRRRIAFATLTALTLLAITGAIFGWKQANAATTAAKDAEDQRGEAAKNEQTAKAESERAREQVRQAARSDFATAHELLENGEWAKAIAYLGRSVRYDPENALAQKALWRSLLYGQPDSGALPQNSFLISPEGADPEEEPVRVLMISPEGARAAVKSKNRLRLLDLVSGKDVAPPVPFVEPLHDLNFSPDGTLLAVASGKTLSIFRSADFQPAGSPLLLDGGIARTGPRWTSLLPILFSYDNSRVVVISESKVKEQEAFDTKTPQLEVFDIQTGARIGKSFIDPSGIGSAVLNRDGSLVAVALGGRGRDQKPALLVIDVPTGKPLFPPVEHEDSMHSPTFSPDGSLLLTITDVDQRRRIGGDNSDLFGELRLWSAASGQPVGSPLRHGGQVRAAAFSPDGTLLLTIGGDATVRLWEIPALKLHCPPLSHGSPLLSAKFSSDGFRIVSCGEDGSVRLWDSRTGRSLSRPLPHPQGVRDAQSSADGRSIVTSCADGLIRIWDVTSCQTLGLPLCHPVSVRTHIRDGLHHTYSVTGAQFDASGTLLATRNMDQLRGSMAYQPGSACVWDLRTGGMVCPPMEHGYFVGDLSFLDEGARLLTSSAGGDGGIWDYSIGRRVKEIEDLDRDGRLVDWHGEDRLTLRKKDANYERSKIVNPDEVKVLLVQKQTAAGVESLPLVHEGEVQFAVFSPDATRVVSAAKPENGDWIGYLWDTATRQRVGTTFPMATYGGRIAFNRDGSLFCVAISEGSIHIRATGTGQVVAELVRKEITKPTGPAEFEGFTFSSDGTKLMAELDRGGGIEVWDVKTRTQIGRTLDHKPELRGAVLGPDGSWLVTCGGYTARVMNVATGFQIGSSLTHDGEVQFVTCSPDGKLLVTTGEENVARLWEADTSQSVTAAVAEDIAAACGGLTLHRQNGILAPVSEAERLNLFASLDSALAGPGLSDWQWAVKRHRAGIPPDEPWFRSIPLNVRDAATRLIASGSYNRILEALRVDPAHPLLPFGFAVIESELIEKDFDKPEIPPNVIRAEWFAAYGLERLPQDAVLAGHAGHLLEKANLMKAAERAYNIAAGASLPPSADIFMLRAVLEAMMKLDRKTESLPVRIRLAKLPAALPSEIGDAAYHAARSGDLTAAKELIAIGLARFSDDAGLFVSMGWSWINLGDSAEALRAFEASVALGRPPYYSLEASNLNAGLAAALWLTGDRGAAMDAFRKMLEEDEQVDWRDPASITGDDWPEAESKPLAALRDATFQKWPELRVPKNQ